MSVFGVILVRRVSLFIQSECGENTDQNNSEYRHFLRSVIWDTYIRVMFTKNYFCLSKLS